MTETTAVYYGGNKWLTNNWIYSQANILYYVMNQNEYTFNKLYDNVKQPSGEISKKPLKDIWTDIDNFAGFLGCKEDKQYSTQKPEALLERIQRKYSPDRFIPNYQELFNKIYKYKQNPFFDVEESMKKIIEFGLLLKRLMEEFDNFLKDYLEFYSKYKKCLEIIHQIIRFLENALIESKIIFKNDVDIFIAQRNGPFFKILAD